MASGRASNPQSWNRYSYALNNPLRYTDPTGMEPQDSNSNEGFCKQDPQRCVALKVNVIYDTNANKGKGLTDKQKTQFEKEQLKKAKEEYGVALIRLDVTYTEGAYDSNKGSFTGVKDDAINVLVTTQNLGGSDAVSQVRNGIVATGINISKADEGTLGHEFAHHLLGHTRSSIGRAMADYGGLPGNMIANLFGELAVGQARMSLANVGPYYGTYPNALLPNQPIPITTPFHSGAIRLQQFLLTQKANRPQQ